MLVLKALQLEPMHGWGITERIEQWSEEGTAARAGHALSGALSARAAGAHSIRVEGHREQPPRPVLLVDARRPRHLSDELAQWQRMSRAVKLVLGARLQG